jgi:hypothetical protein
MDDNGIGVKKNRSAHGGGAMLGLEFRVGSGERPAKCVMHHSFSCLTVA